MIFNDAMDDAERFYTKEEDGFIGSFDWQAREEVQNILKDMIVSAVQKIHMDK